MQLARAFDRSSALVAVTDAVEGRLVDVNQRFLTALGYARDDIIGRTPDEIGLWDDPGDRARVRAQALLGRTVEQLPIRFRTKVGDVHEGLLSVDLIRLDDADYLFSYVQDITGHLEQQTRLAEVEARYRTLVDNSRDGITVSQAGRWVFVNRAFASMVGRDASEIEGQLIADVVHPAFRDAMDDLTRRRAQGEREAFDYETELLYSDGVTRVPVAIRSNTLELDGRIASMASVRDISRDRVRERALREAEEKYRSIYENAIAGMYRSTPDGRFIEANPALAEIFGYDSPEQLMQQLEHIRDLYVDPDERAPLLETLEQHGSVSGLEYQIRRRDGAVIWVGQHARVVRAKDGEILYYEGALLDITARKQAELELARSEERFRSLVQHTDVGVFANQNGYYTYTNDAFARILGYGERELIGVHYKTLFPPEQIRAADERYRRRMSGQEVENNYETQLLHRDGTTRVDVQISVGAYQEGESRMLIGTVLNITDRKRAERQLIHNATHDDLTGLANRSAFLSELEAAITARDRDKSFAYAVLFFDLDRFKVVNDSLGHSMGDELLVQVAHRLQHRIGDAELIARLGGDEFVVLLRSIRRSEDAKAMAARVIDSLRDPFRLAGSEVHTGCSIGVVMGSDEYRGTQEVMRDADIAMYRAKARAEVEIVVFEPEMREGMHQRLRLETDLRHGLEREEFEVHYQPILSTRDWTVCGLEALVRWQHPGRGLLLPIEFLPAAEESGLIHRLDWWVMETACGQLLKWRTALPHMANVRVSINLDNAQFLDPDLADRVERLLSRAGLEPDAVNLEITEQIFHRGLDAVRPLLERLKALGVRIYLDDFGTGYSSFEALRDLPLDAVKIDRSFVTGIESADDRVAIVRTILRLADDLGLDVVAEGLELDAHREVLLELGCPAVQGFLFSPAVPADSVLGLMQPDGVFRHAAA
jgi:diguanylate cyclase (GGDEF)-like protein/PAS domain S-box-containing protein